MTDGRFAEAAAAARALTAFRALIFSFGHVSAGALTLLLGGCASLHDSTREASFTKKHGEATYCEVETVRQTGQKTCGLACLSSILLYWEKSVGEPELRQRYPLTSGAGYALQQLQSIATQEGLLAFAVDMSEGGKSPARELSQHLQKGRPILIALHCPQGRYFGAPIPLIETLDRRTWKPFGLGETFKHHYVVVLGETADTYLVMDPAYGIGEVRKQPLLDWWKAEGYAALVCSRMPVSAPAGENVLAPEAAASQHSG